MVRKLWLIGVCLFFSMMRVEAALVNGNFNSGLTGWDISPLGLGSIIDQSEYFGSGADGNQVLVYGGEDTSTATPIHDLSDFLNPFNSSMLNLEGFNGVGFLQTFAVEPGSLFRLSFDWDFLTNDHVGDVATGIGQVGNDYAFVTLAFQAPTGPVVELIRLASTINAEGSQDHLSSLSTAGSPTRFFYDTGGLQTYTSPVFALASAQSTITIGFGIVEVYASDFVNVDPLLLHSGLVLDNIVFTTDVNTVVPEPATLWLLSLGLVGLLMWQRWYGAAPRALLKARQTRHDE